ncbi:BRCA1-associated ATM activator 1 [Notolabrus celidotus]|uniref:BRCA1-associated ATM activator 1 n=1 Tax=Notolabrus celidotus TaxID=1203425 RepID=UPI00148F933F|nr:BRCA1-associated ATM activator 1 [Notolabrus celidotus]
MDRECVSLLPRVCEVLADSGRSLPDDTSLEKLLDWFTGLNNKAGDSLLESCPCLIKFISAVIDDKDSDPSVLSFTLKVTGLIASTEDGFKTLQERSVLDVAFSIQHWRDAELWEDPCVRIGWIQGLNNSLQHPKALSFFVKSDFIEPLLKLQTDSSLFVASAANHMLAHIMLFFQPASSAGCNSVYKKDKANGSTKTLNIDSEQPAADHTAVVKVISEYLRESLVPKDNTQLHQSLQTLKMLVLLLAQAGHPLRDELLQTVTGSLEEVVTAGCSQLTSLLMNVVLAAYRSSSTDERVPDQRVDRLLSSMLNINKPSDLIRAAAAFLHSGHQDASHTAQAVRILLLPLEIITGHNLLDSNTTAKDHQVTVAEHLKSKTSCISVICTCLSTTANIPLLPSGLLPCPPVLIIPAVLSLLRICSGVSSTLSSGCSETCRNVIGSGKIQKCALEALMSLSSSPGAQEEVGEVFAVLIEYLKNPDSDPTVLHKSYQALVKWISVCKDLSFSIITDQIRQDLSNVVRKRVCDMRWEVRDSTVEFLGHVADIRVLKSAGEVCSASEALLGGCCATSLLREALQDTESYVRASAVSALAKTLTHSWQQGAELTQEETEIVSRLLEILSQDTEGFARRAAVRYFITWFSSSSSSSSSLLMQSVRSILSQGSADLDWEVKVHTLELAEHLMDKSFSGQKGYRKDSVTTDTQPHPYGVVSEQTSTLHSHTHSVESGLVVALKDLVELGVVSALMIGLVDCDRPVGLKACQLLIILRETVCPLSLGAQDATMATIAQVSCELPGSGWGREIRKILAMKTNDLAREEGRSLNGAGRGGTEEECEVEEDKNGKVSMTVGVCEVLRSLGLDDRLEVLNQSSDHIHNSPLSLLQDILTARVAHTSADTQSGQEVIVDCY